ncbi:MAG: DNA-processing protein DprA [Paludibacteraceae bacterium]|nr:DNA-processing protein DprA [Paludibacteraceae bacterium]
MDELTYQIAWTCLYPTRLRTTKQWLEQYGSASAAWERLEVEGKQAALERAQQEREWIDQHNISTYFYQDDTYPYRLRECIDAPILLYGKGHLRVNEGKMLSIVGTRQASDRCKSLVRQLVLDLKEMVPDITIISGLAYGIDVAAHRAALEAGLPTWIIPAHGLDRIYPSLHRDVAVQALEKGGILTEYISGTEPEKLHFVARNRIVAGLADAVLVAESKQRGGSLITAKMARDYNRDLFAFPGRPSDDSMTGCNMLIRDQKAQLIENAQDLVNAMQWEPVNQPIQTSIFTMPEDITKEQKQLLELLEGSEEGIHVNLLVMETQRPYADVASDLMMLDMMGVVKSLPGGVYKTQT